MILYFRVNSPGSYYFWKLVKMDFKNLRKNQKKSEKNNLKI